MGHRSDLVFDFNARCLRRVLLVISDGDERRRMLTSLRDDGHDVVSIRDLSELAFACEAIRYGFGLKPHVIVLDAGFAGGAGLTIALRQQPLRRSSRLILVGEGAALMDAAREGVDPWAILERPFEDDDLRLAILHERMTIGAPDHERSAR